MALLQNRPVILRRLLIVAWQAMDEGDRTWNVYTLQHTATHCNTLQRTAAHCNTLQHTATHCNTLQHNAAHCNTLQHTATHDKPQTREIGQKIRTTAKIGRQVFTEVPTHIKHVFTGVPKLSHKFSCVQMDVQMESPSLKRSIGKPDRSHRVSRHIQISKYWDVSKTLKYLETRLVFASLWMEQVVLNSSTWFVDLNSSTWFVDLNSSSRQDSFLLLREWSYWVAKTHRIPYLCRLVSAKVTYI